MNHRKPRTRSLNIKSSRKKSKRLSLFAGLSNHQKLKEKVKIHEKRIPKESKNFRSINRFLFYNCELKAEKEIKLNFNFEYEFELEDDVLNIEECEERKVHRVPPRFGKIKRFRDLKQ